VAEAIDGFYAAYLTGAAAYGLAILVLRNGRLVGADVAGTKISGTFEPAEGGGNRLRIEIVLQGGGLLIQGVQAPPEGESYSLDFVLPGDFLARPSLRIETKHGPINARFVRIGDVDA
jgi:hypothetical protein